jgi:hypothetical protein
VQISQPGNARDPAAAQHAPKQNHEAAVGQNEIGVRHRRAVNGIFAQPLEAGPRGRHNEPGSNQGAIDRLRGRAVKEANAHDLLGR